MDHLETATQMLFRGAWLASIDLSDAYYTLPIHPDFQRYICFQWAGRFFHYTCLPFGISCAPWIFTKTLKPIFAEFHKKGHHGFRYIDDSFIIAETRVECLRAVNELKASFERLGFRINEKKSVLQPTHVLKFLGYLLNSSTMTVSPTQDKIEKVVGSVQELLNCRRIKIRRVASVLGLLNDVCKATEYGSAHTKNLEVQKIEALRKAGSKQFEGTMYLDTESVMDLRWWGERFPTATKTIRETSPVLTLMVDASQLGWGACLGSERAQGRWSIHEGTCHINVLEVRAVLLGLRSLCADKHGTGIGVLTDSTTALAYVSHMGGTRSRECNRAALELWHWCEQRGIWLTVNHIPGVENVVADYESRNFTENTEWKLNPQLFAQICKLWNTPNIDLFASRVSHQLPTSASWGPDPGASFVNAFSRSWSDLCYVYVFPPFRLLLRVLQKIRHDGVKAIVVAPDWPAHPWHSILHTRARNIKSIPRGAGNLLRVVPAIKEDKELERTPLIFALL